MAKRDRVKTQEQKKEVELEKQQRRVKLVPKIRKGNKGNERNYYLQEYDQ